MKRRVPVSVVKGLTAAALCCGMAAHANLVANGDFETGDFTSWSTSVDPVWDAVDTLVPQAGSYAAYFGKPGGTSTISQTLATVAGTTYAISFWLMLESDVTGNAAPNAFAFNWDGAASELVLTDAAAFGYTQYQYQLTASSASTDLAFSFSNTASFWDFDSVDVVAVTNEAPEPGSLALAAIAALGGALVTRRRRSPAESAPSAA